MITSPSLEQEDQERRLKSQNAVNLGLVTNICLAALKVAFGILAHSPALLADGINSVSDVAYYLVVGVFLRLAAKPADDDHPYGHTQLESIAALVVGSFVITTAIAVFWESVNDIYELWIGESDYGGAAVAALVVAISTILIKIGLYQYTRRVGETTSNTVLLALAYDHRNDIFTATAATIGIAMGRAGLHWVDPLAGALVALVILRTGFVILRQSAYDLMDTVPGNTLRRQVNDLLCENPGIRSIEEIHAHRFGPYLVINLTIGIDGDLSVRAGDRIATEAEQTLFRAITGIRRVHVHYHPAPPGVPGKLQA